MASSMKLLSRTVRSCRKPYVKPATCLLHPAHRARSSVGIPKRCAFFSSSSDRNERLKSASQLLQPQNVAEFHVKGYTVVRQALPLSEVRELESTYDEFMSKKRAVPGRDYGDHSQGHGVPEADFALVNVNQPTLHHPDWAGNSFEELCSLFTELLFGPGMKKDYDQLLTKLPNKPQAVFPLHQDMGYWVKKAQCSTRTATFSLALTDATEQHGCLYVVVGPEKVTGLVGTHSDDKPRSRDEIGDGRALELELQIDETKEKRVFLPVRRGDITIHDEWIVHGSEGNRTAEPRKTYVVAFRDEAMVEYQRRVGYNHSYNDDPAVISAARKGLI